MANPFKDLFKSKYTTYYSVDDLSDEQKAEIQRQFASYQANPEQYDEEYGTAITELERRLRTPDPLLSTYESIQDDTTGRGAFQQRRTLEEKRLAVSAKAKERKKYKTSYLYGQVEDYEPKNPLTDVQSVIDQEDSAKVLENKINEEKEQKRQKYTELIGMDPYKNSRAAFDKWMSDNPELVDEVIERSPKIKEDGSVAYVELLRKFQNSVAKGTLEKDFFDIEKPKEEKIPQFTQRKRDYSDAFRDIELVDLIPFYKDFKEAGEIGIALKYLNELQSGEELSPEKIEFLETFSEENAPTDDTIGAKIVDTMINMIPFAGEIFASYGAGYAIKKGAKATAGKVFSENVKKEVKDALAKYTKTATAAKVTGQVAEVGLKTAGLVKVGYMDDKLALQKRLPAFEFANDGIVIQEEGMDEATANRQASAEAYIEYASEFSGPVLRWITGGTFKKFRKVYKGLSKGQKEVAVSQAVANTAADYIKKQNPAIKITKDTLVKIRQWAQTAGYDGVLEEWGEERVGDATRAFLYKLSESGIIDGFDNEQYVDNVVTQLAAGEYGTAGENMVVELVSFSAPIIGMGGVSISKDAWKERVFKRDYADIAKIRDEKKEKNKETQEEYLSLVEKLENKKKLGKKDTKRLEELADDRRMSESISVIETIVKENPKLKNEADIEIIDEIGEVTAEQLEEQGTSMEEEGLPKDTKKAKFTGKTWLKNNLKLGLELRKGADLDTAVEEYFGLAYRGGLTDKQSDAFEEYYDRYTTDAEFRTKVNEKINELIPGSVSDVTQTLSEQELFEKEGKGRFYEAQLKPKDFIDKLYDGIKNNFNKVFGNITLDDKIREVYEKAGARKVKIKAERAQKLEERRAKRQERQEERQAKQEVKETEKQAKVEAKVDRKRKRLKPGVKPTLDETFEDAEYDEVAAPELEDLPEIVSPKPKEIKKRKEVAKKIKSKPRLFNFLNRRARKLARKKIETVSPVAIREVKIKIEQEAPKQVIPDDPRQPLEILRDILGDEQFQELTGIYTGPIQQIETIEPRIIETLKEKFEPLPYESLDFFDVIPEKKQEEILKEVEKKVGKETIKPIRDLKKPTKPKKKDISYQLSVLDVSKKLANPKEVTEEDKVDVAVHEGLKETIKAIEETDDGVIHESLQWYFTSVDKTMDISSNEINIEDTLDEDVYKMIIAINSQKTRPVPNYNYAIDIFGHYQKNGEFNYKPTATTGKIRLHSKNLKGDVKIVGGLAGKVMTNQHKKLEFLFEKFGKEKAMNWLKTKHTGREILDVLEESGLVKSRPQHLPATVDNDMFYGAHMFGPKIGAFYANLSGKTDVATYDLWWSRTWNRWMGTPTTTTKKGEEFIVDVPRSMKERALMDEAITRISETLTEATGYKFTPPAVQAVLWYYEKELYIKNDADADLGVDFLRAAQARAKEKGYATTPKSTKRARRVTEQRIAKEKADTASLKEGIKKTGKKARQKAPQVSYQLKPIQEVLGIYGWQDQEAGIGIVGGFREQGFGVKYVLEKTKDWAIVREEFNVLDLEDQTKPIAKLVLRVKKYKDRNAEIDGIIDIEVKRGGKKKGVGAKVIRGIVDRGLVASDKFKIFDIRKKALGFWEKMGVEGLVYRGARELPNYNEKTPIKKRSDIARLDKQHGIAIDGYIPVKKAKPKAKPSYQLTPGQKKSLKGVDPELLNPDGTPKVFYHGTPAEDFDRFDMDRISEGTGMAGEGMHFTDNPKVASEYAGEQGAPRMYPVYLLGKKMAVYDAKGKGWDNAEWWIGYKDAKLYEIQQIHKEGFEHYDNRNMLKSNYRSEENLLKFPKTDGVIFKNINEMSPDGKDNKEGLGTTVVMFKPGQIKSATAFAEKPDVKDPRISYQLKPTQKEFLKDTKVVDFKGNPLPVYHATRAPKGFEIFEKTEDIGFHAGSKSQANRRITKSKTLSDKEYYKSSNIMKLYYNIKNPMYLPDLNNWYPLEVLQEIKSQYGFKDIPELTGYGDNRYKEIVDYIKSKGFDGVIYINDYETRGDKGADALFGVYRHLETAKDKVQFLINLSKISKSNKELDLLSYIAFDANQIKSATAMADKPTTDPRISYQLKPTQKDWNKNSVIKKGVYHGTRAEFEEFKDGGWFAENPDMANSFAFGFAPGAPQIYKAYLNIEKPLDFRKFFSKINKEYTFKEFTRALKNLTNNKIPIDMLKRIEKEESDETGVVRGGEGYEYTDIINFQPELKNWLLSEGFDGIIVPQEHKGIMEDTYFAFNANQIKSATAMADKPTKDPRISYQLKPADQPLELPDETWREVFIRKIVNRLNRLENVTSEIGDVDEQTNAYLAAVLYEGKAEDRIDKFQKYIERYIKRLTKAGFTVDDIGEYLYARHAKERNDRVHEENPDFEGTGSGMTNEEADEILNKFKGSGIYKFAREFDKKVIRARLDILRDGGLITEETYDLFTKDSPYKNYVPLKGTSEKKGRGTGTSGFSIVGKDIRRKRGRDSRADNPFVQALIDYEMAIVRAEKNAVTSKFYLFALENPTNLWEVGGRRHIPRYDKEGEIAFFDPMTLQQNQVQAFVDGKLKVITINDEALLNAMKNLGSGTTFKFAQQFNTYLRAIYTTFNPEFLITNFERDIQTALTNIQADADIKVTAKIMKDIMGGAPMRAIYRTRRDKGDAKLSVNKKKLELYRKYYAEYKKEGGAVGWVASQSVEEKLNELKKVMARAQSSRNPKQFFRYLGKWVEDMNMTVEQAVRLATYANLRESGLSKAESAKISKELTVNFNQKGEWGSFINSLYLFSNATIQGNYFWMRAFARSNKVKAVTLGMVLSTVLLNIINRMNGGDDWEKYSDYEKDFHWLYILPNGNVVKFKVPYGYNIFHVMGNVIEEVHAGKTTPSKAMSRLFNSIVHAVSPIGAGEGLSQYVPTAFGLKQVAEIWANENFMGGKIYPDQPHYQPKKPDSQLYFDSVNPSIKGITTWLNKVSGGSEKVSGKIDVSPETIEHLLTAFTGGAGKFIERSYRTGKQLLAGETPPLKEIPFVRTAVSEPSKYTMLYKMYDMLGSSARTIYTEKEIEDFNRYLRMSVEDKVITNAKAKNFKNKFIKNQKEAKASMK